MISIAKKIAAVGPTAFHQAVKRRTRILLADDNLPLLELYAQILRNAGYDVLTAITGGQALQLTRERAPDLLVLDVVLPDVSGIEVCRRIKADAALGEVFIILISGEAISSEQTVDGLSIGADEYLCKPVEPREFLARIHTAVRLMDANTALRASEQHYRRLVDILPDAVALIDLRFRLVGINERAAAMLGYAEPDELPGRNVFDLIQEKDRERFRADMTALKDGAIGTAEYDLLTRSKKCIPVEMTAALSKDPNGESLGWVTVARDTTDRKRVEEELRRLPQRITEAQEDERLRMARELHDGVNQEIASAAMRLRRVQNMVADQSPAASEILSRCHKLLMHALDENRRIARNLRPGDLDELGLRAACRNLCKGLQARNGVVIKCQFTRFDRRLPPKVDLSIFRMVQEALNNVEKHARAKLVRLRIAIHSEDVVLKVQDDGRGFDATSPKTGKGKERGLGLHSLRERAAAVGGRCDVISTPSQGTTITVRLPFAKAATGEAS